MTTHSPLVLWTFIAPTLTALLYGGSLLGWNHYSYIVVLITGLFATILAAVHHAEVIAHRIGEPFGALVLALCVTLIEVALIVSIMLSGGEEATALARDTVFATIMIILNGITGLALLIGGLKHYEQNFGIKGISASLTTLVAITVLTLILPNFTTSVAGPYYSQSQLIFVAIVSLILYASFILVQTIRHKEYFLSESDEQELHEMPPSTIATLTSTIFLVLSLIIVVLLSKVLSPIVTNGVEAIGAPHTLVGIIIASVVLLPEGLSALKAARQNRLQTSLNLAFGSALASIGLTIPAVALVSLSTGLTLTLGLDIKSMVLLLLSLFVTGMALGTGRTTILQGIVLLVLFAVYLFVTIVP